jgi:hypothetical protein
MRSCRNKGFPARTGGFLPPLQIISGLVFGTVLSLLGSSCSHKRDDSLLNRRPGVRLTGGPVSGEKAYYRSEFFWSGWDQDGVIDHYQYAIDIPSDLLAWIDDPDDHGIAWKDTLAFRAAFSFRTADPDSAIGPDGQPSFTGDFIGEHSLFVRSVDNEGSVSRADYLTFTAKTVTPRTTIVSPPRVSEVDYLSAGRIIRVTWEGFDPDSPDSRKRPVAYEYKLIDLADRLPVGLDMQYWVDYHAGTPWTHVGRDTTSVTLSLDPPRTYIFAVRSIDEAGAVESVFIKGRNAFAIDCSSSLTVGQPILTVSQRDAGSHTFPTMGYVWDIEVLAGRCLRFEFSATAIHYGGEIQCFNWGLDVPDPDNEGPNSGFHGCSLIPYTFEPICFQSEGIHALTVKCRDTGGTVTTGTVIIHVVPFSRDREVLYVDDHRLPIGQGISDAIMDDRATAMLVAAGYAPEQIDRLDAWGPMDGNSTPEIIKLSVLARYRMIVWSNMGAGFSGESSLAYANLCQSGRILQTYVGAGGGLWVYGQMVAASFKLSASRGDCLPDLNYGEGLSYQPGEFMCDFMHLCSPSFRDVRSEQRLRDGMLAAQPTAEASAELFPPVEADSAMRSAVGGIANVDAMFEPNFEPGLDTLYVLQTVLPTSSYRNKPIAFRYADPDPVPAQGPVALFCFPMHLVKQGTGEARTGAAGLARSLIDWFRSRVEVGAGG